MLEGTPVQADPVGARVAPHVREMRLTDEGRHVEIEVESSEPFYFGNDETVLQIGTHTFTRSRPAPDGSPNRLIFIVPVASYHQLPDAQTMEVRHGQDARHPDRRPIGRLDKTRLKEATR